jgi:hypothetical protein
MSSGPSGGAASALLTARPEPSPDPEPATSPKPGASLFDDDLPDLAPLTAAHAASSVLPGANKDPDGSSLGAAIERLSQEQRARDEAALNEYFKPPVDEEFSFPCKVCGTLLYASASRVGSMTRCPDCHSEFSIPSPPVKKKIPKIVIDDAVADVRLAPVESTNPRTQMGDSIKTKEILDKAAIEADRERQEIESVVVAFDSRRWLSMIFGFLRDPGIVFLAVLLGIFAAACFYALHAAGNMEMPLVQIWILRAILFAIFGVPVLVSILMCCMVILPMAADRKTRVDEWPFGRFGDAMGELSMVLSAIAIAAVPGGILATLLSWVGVVPIVREILVLGSIWGLLPILLLSMIENNRITEPFSKAVFGSISARPDAWGAMYFQTGIMIAALFVLFGIAVITNPITSALLGLAVPFGLFFIANQYGILAGRVSDVTHLGFEGDFSQDYET